ncbi:MAG TPA: Clp protease ClpP [Gordonia sp. (in: high G+C Gram-positive bacteria)]|uniref:head maturation protease, ClpP-related n=1 Tax=unclassified Gordonia (in: high G+C Gram-positive bacteria) TaxID=2657482 RepID=UPI0025C38331|nr:MULTISPECIES: head maturation protease, ClpP-related [unclassified Gordonia (in: high G+C Gram-positive bacteria)]HNP57510.1 Clp protease ClpP [Gordonia sp. (in: high G+C Gram-positive bacteria)]HRC51105.1 Clp protease ClpP [Gordonia sp. (in: high G+C Gram-positive bacteria)]
MPVGGGYLTRQPSQLSPNNAPADSWYRFAATTTTTGAEVFIYDAISGRTSVASFIAELAALDGAPVTVRINSGGGDVYSAIAIANAIRRHPGRTTVVVDGLAASAASFIAVCADQTLIAPNAELMIHDAAVLDTSGNPAELRDLADDLDRISDNIASMYAAKAGGSVESWRKLMRTETWYTAEQAVTAGLADRILTEDRPAAIRGNNLRIVAAARRARTHRK